MDQITFSYDDSLISEKDLRKTSTQLLEEIERMNNAVHQHYDDDRASLSLPDDKEALSTVKKLIQTKKELSLKYLVVIGIGGSNLGTMAVLDAVFGKLSNFTTQGIQVFYADTVDSDLMSPIVTVTESALKKGENVLINCISKSGHTTETIANFEVLIDLIRRYKPDYKQSIVITTDENSEFFNMATEKGFDVLTIPKKVGGRFSVFSPVGLFPLGLAGVNIDDLVRGARVMRERCLSKNVMENPAALSALLIFLQKKNGKQIHDLFLFNPDLESVGRWYRQLMAESIGKEYNLKKKQVFEGVTPTVSIGSTDLHSIGQLYLGGPFDKFTTFVRVQHNNNDVRIPHLPEYESLVKSIQGKSLDDIMHAILDGVQAAFRKQKRPFMEITLPDKSAFSIGQLLQLKMMETMYLGFLLGVNPFDQPNVESYKIETRRILEG